MAIRGDILSSLKNAIERGSPLSLAKQTLINAGYNPSEVEEAGNFLSGGLATTQYYVNQNIPPQNIPPQINPHQIQNLSESHQTTYQKPREINYGLLIFLIIVLALLLGTLVLSIIFQEEIINFLGGNLSS